LSRGLQGVENHGKPRANRPGGLALSVRVAVIDMKKSLVLVAVITLLGSCSEPNEVTPDVIIQTTMNEYHASDTVRVIISNPLEDTLSFFRCQGLFVCDLQRWDKKWFYITTLPFCGADRGDTALLGPHTSVTISLLDITDIDNPFHSPGVQRLVFHYWSDDRPKRDVYSNTFSVLD
jgi:hypothetical protein